MNDNLHDDFKEFMNTNLLLSDVANSLKENIWDQIKFQNTKNYIWLKVAAALLVASLSFTCGYLVFVKNSSKMELTEQIEKLKIDLKRNQDTKDTYFLEIKKLKHIMSNQENQIKPTSKWEDNRRITTINKVDTVIVYYKTEPEIKIIHDSIIIEKIVNNQFKKNPNSYSDEIPTQLVFSGEKNKSNVKVRFGLRNIGFLEDNEVNTPFNMIRIKIKNE